MNLVKYSPRSLIERIKIVYYPTRWISRWFAATAIPSSALIAFADAEHMNNEALAVPFGVFWFASFFALFGALMYTVDDYEYAKSDIHAKIPERIINESIYAKENQQSVQIWRKSVSNKGTKEEHLVSYKADQEDEIFDYVNAARQKIENRKSDNEVKAIVKAINKESK